MQGTTAATQGSPAPTPAPDAPAAAAPAAAPRPVAVVVTNADGTTQTLAVPLTKQDVENIKARREELSSQLTSAAGRRRRLADEMAQQPAGPARTGMEGRLSVLDVRLAQLESDIAATGRQLSAAPEGLLTSEEQPAEGDMPDNVMAVSIVFTLFVLTPLAFTLARNLWKRGSRPAVQAQALPHDTRERLERLEQGVEAIAIEIERVSEGQRFVTKILSDTAPSARLQSPERVAEKA